MGGIQSRQAPEPFSHREVEILTLMKEGLSNDAIAQKLSLSLGTVKWYNRQIFGKLGVTSRTQAIQKAIETRVIDMWSYESYQEVHQKQLVARVKHCLPAPLTAFIGRKKERAELQKMLLNSNIRLVTILGAGGIGKTRLALRVAEDLLPNLADGIWLVDLSRINKPDLLPQFIANVLGIRDTPGFQYEELLIRYLRSRVLLLVIDNCEHLVQTCARLVFLLLTNCPDLCILSTSREALGVDGEVLYPLQSMQFPDLNKLAELDTLKRYEAVQLFVERAVQASPTFTLNLDNMRGVAHICQRLDGIPLALELAAARISLLSVDQIETRLDDCFQLLAAGSHTALPRHQTMRASLDWSYNLLSSSEQRLLCRLAVLAGEWTLEAVESICQEKIGDESIGSTNERLVIMDLLTSLKNKSMVIASLRSADMEGDGTRRTAYRQEVRYRMLEPIRQYAQEKLEQSGDMEYLRERHLTFFAQLAEKYGPMVLTIESNWYVRLLRSDLENFRAALQWAIVDEKSDGMPTRVEKGLRIAAGLGEFWMRSGLFNEGRTWLSKAIVLTRDSGPQLNAVRALALRAIGALESLQGDQQTAKQFLEEGILILRNSEDRKDLALALSELALWSFPVGPETANLAIEESVILALQIGDRDILANALSWRGYLKIWGRDLDGALQDLQESLLLALETKNLQVVCYNLVSLGNIALRQDDLESALRYREEFLRYQADVEDVSLHYFAGYFLTETSYRLGDFRPIENLLEMYLEESWGQIIPGKMHFLRLLGIARKCHGDFASAMTYFNESLSIAQEANDPYFVYAVISELAGTATQAGKPVLAARLFGAVENLCEIIQQPLTGFELYEFQQDVSKLHETIPFEEFCHSWAEGRSMTPENTLRDARLFANGLI